MVFPDILDGPLAIAAAIMLVAGLLRGFAGFGSAMFAAPGFAVLFGPHDMVVIVTLCELAVSAQLWPGAYRHTEWRFVGPLTAASLLGMPLGGYVLMTVDPAVIARGIAAVVVVFVAVLATGWRYGGPKRLGVTLPLGVFSGAMMATTSVGGPPVLLYMLAGPDKAVTNRANIISYFGITGVALMGLFQVAGIVAADSLWRGAVLTPFMLAGALAGARLFRQSSEKLYRRTALVFLLAAGLYGVLR